MNDEFQQKSAKVKIHKIKRVNSFIILLFIFGNDYYLQNKTFLLEDIFHFDGKNKSKIKINRGIRRIKGESDKEYEIRMIENKSFNNKLNENYVKKMSLLLYEKISDKIS